MGRLPMLNPLKISKLPISQLGNSLHPSVFLLHSVELGDWKAHPDRNTLSKEERTRAEGFSDPLAQATFVWGRMLARSVLGGLLGESPDSILFKFGSNGKPLLATGPTPTFSLSHSGPWVGLAVHQNRQVGLDIEALPGRNRPVVELARRYFLPEEARSLEATPSELQKEFFLKLWTQKEATLKAKGGAAPKDLTTLPESQNLDLYFLDLSQLKLESSLIGHVALLDKPLT